MFALLATLVLLLQPGVQPGPKQTTQGLGDTDPLSKDLGRDARTPDGNGFSRLYELPRRRGQPRRFARVSGGLIAVFPSSTYEDSDAGPVATVPPGTVYYVGSGWMAVLMNPAHNDPDPGVLAAPTAIDLGVQASRDTAVSQVPLAATSAADVPSIWTDETFRRARLNALLARRTP